MTASYFLVLSRYVFVLVKFFSNVYFRYRERLGKLSAGMRLPHTDLQELTAMGGQQERPADVYSDFISEEDVDAICKVLKKQRDGLQHLTDILTLVYVQIKQIN